MCFAEVVSPQFSVKQQKDPAVHDIFVSFFANFAVTLVDSSIPHSLTLTHISWSSF